MNTSRKPTVADPATLEWIRSRHSGGEGGMCVEVAHIDGGVAVRDSKAPLGAILLFSGAEWGAFLAGVRDGQFDDPPALRTVTTINRP
ncbi:protein of unknown function (DUF397) [Parafrankia irregularis]|uniref:DUF397 domain-containing protein n=1 Tax=Parafrankia irregularis TaxID=795642 RepID=A0A0S4QV39_9ACTN|nr:MULTISPECIES: DUF397 domain-containing protein [Parafrankia]MBE3203750.1 DUF397 domain-containing protein [Parafrankia sp. CH37]CUU59007.1 protein of unknown function (DUF397) [Parafrankia irregularis]